MKQYTAQEIEFYKKLFEDFIDRDLLNSKLKAKEYAQIAESKGDEAFVALFRALEHDGGSKESKKIAVGILEPWYKKLNNVDGFEFYISYYAALLMATGDPITLSVCNDILNKYPESFQALTSKGIILLRKNRTDESIILFDKALIIRPNSPWPMGWLAIAYAQKKDYKKAGNLLFKAYDISKDKTTVNNRINRFLRIIKLNTPDEYIIWYDKFYKPTQPPIQKAPNVKRKKRKFNLKVFLGHSGEPSRKIANELKILLEKIFPSLEVLYSEDIPGGKKWYDRILNNLAESDCGVFCITKYNTESAWIHFEAGALSLPNSDEKIIPFLFNIELDEKDPLFHSQHANQSRKGILTLLKGINEKSGNEVKYRKKDLDSQLGKHWNKLNRKFKIISKKYEL